MANRISIPFDFVFLFINSALHRSFGDHQVAGIGKFSYPIPNLFGFTA
jgi:hypothetical protein